MRRAKRESEQTTWLFPEYKQKPAVRPTNTLYFENPKNDNERMINLQHWYYEGNKGAYAKLLCKIREIAIKLVKVEMKTRGLSFCTNTILDYADEAMILVAEQYEKNWLVITDSFVSYIRFMVYRAMYHQTQAQKFEAYCCKYGIQLFDLSADEKFAYKRVYEKEYVPKKGE